MKAAEIARVIGQVIHGIRRGAAQRRHARVVQIGQVFAHGKLVAIDFPKRLPCGFGSWLAHHSLSSTKTGRLVKGGEVVRLPIHFAQHYVSLDSLILSCAGNLYFRGAVTVCRGDAQKFLSSRDSHQQSTELIGLWTLHRGVVF